MHDMKRGSTSGSSFFYVKIVIKTGGAMKRLTQKIGIFGITMLLASTTLFAHDYSGHWAEGAIKEWMNYGIVTGYEDQSFKPNQPITRAEFAAILSRTFNLSSVDGADIYVDLVQNEDKWYVTPINQVMALRLMYIEGNYFKPDLYITREEAAYALAQAYELESDGATLNFKDQVQISAWAMESVSSLVQAQYLKGNPDGTFKPQGTLTRAELVTMLSNITKKLYYKSGTYTESVKGNAVISSANVKLKDMTIDGDLYITQGIEAGKVQLENVTVTGKVIVNSGAVSMSGNYNEVHLATTLPVTFSSGQINALEVEVFGATMTVAENASIKKLVQNQPIVLNGKGLVEGRTIEALAQAKVKAAGIYINGKYEALPVVDNVVVLDVTALMKKYGNKDVLSGLSFTTNLEGGEVISAWGKMQSGKVYSFSDMENELGFIKEMALEVGISPSLVVSYILGDETLTLGSLLEDYKLAQKLSESLEIELKDTYEFIRVVNQSEGRASLVKVVMTLK